MADASLEPDGFESPAGRVRIGRYTEPSAAELAALFDGMRGGAVHSPFQVPVFFDAFRRHAAPATAKTFTVLTAALEGGGAADLLLPLVTFRRGPVNMVTLPDFGLADQNAPVLSRPLATNRDLATVLCDGLLSACRLGDLVDIPKISAGIGLEPNPLFHLPDTFGAGASYWFDADALEAVERQPGKSVFREARVKFRKLQQQGVRLVEVTDPEQRCALLERLLEQRRQRFAELGRTDSIETENRAAFYRALAEAPGQATPFKLLTLQRAQEVVAAAALMARGDSANGILLSIGDASWHRLSPGIVLVVATLQWARDNGIRCFSFGTGLQGYKQRFGAAERPVRRLLRPLTAKGRVFATALQAKLRARSFLEQLERSPEG